VVLGVPSYFLLGFLRPGPEVSFGSSERAFGAPGAGDSFAFADPDARLGYAYVMNKLDFHLVDDPREKALRDAIYRAIARRADRRDRDINAPYEAPRAPARGMHDPTLSASSPTDARATTGSSRAAHPRASAPRVTAE
jgi:CubicO group peptidase (beta-lactamase class C family)